MNTEAEKIEKSSIKLRLKRVLSLSDAVTIGIGSLIGGGIFTLTGLALSSAGPSLILVILLNGIIAFMTALAYAELGSTFPEAGGGFFWVKRGMGNLAGHVSGWISWFANAVACGLYSLSFAFYFGIILFSFILPLFGISLPFTEGNLFQKLITVSIILSVGFINFKGISETGRLGKIIVYLEVLALSTFIIFGLISFFKKPDITAVFTPLFPAGIFGLFSAMGLMYIGFEGTEIIANSGEELKNPQKNIPRAIFVSLGVICLLYLLTIFGALAGVKDEIPSWEVLSVAGQGALVKASSFFMPGLEWIVIFGGLLAASAALNSTIFASSHVSFSMGRAGTLPKFLSKIHPKNQTPYIAIIISTLLVLTIAIFLPLKEVAAVTNLLFIFLFAQIHLALIALRKKMPDVYRPFRIPLYPIPSLIALFAYGLLIFQFFHISLIGVVITSLWILSGVLIYFAYSKPVEIKKIEKEILFEEKVRLTEKKKYQILLPIHPDLNWRDMLTFALSVAKEKNAEICILHVKEIPYPLPLMIEENELKEDKEFLEETLILCGVSKINADAILMVSRSLSKAVIDMIKKEGPNLLILGWKGYTKATYIKKFFGKNLDKILREANCDVIVARINKLGDLKNILIPNSSGIQIQSAEETAKIIIKAFGRKINVVFIAPKKEAKKFGPEKKLKNIVSSLEIPAHISLKSEVLYVEHPSPQSIAYQIIQKSRDFGCILMTSAKGKVFRGMIFGEIPELVVRNSFRSLILIKHHRTFIAPFISRIYNKLG